MTPPEYRARAEACESQAAHALNPDIRRSYEDLARQWRDLAEQSERHALTGARARDQTE